MTLFFLQTQDLIITTHSQNNIKFQKLIRKCNIVVCFYNHYLLSKEQYIMDNDSSPHSNTNSDQEKGPFSHQFLSQNIEDTHSTEQNKNKNKKKRIRKRSGKLTLPKGTRPEKNAGPNGIKKIKNVSVNNPYLRQRIGSISNPNLVLCKNHKDGWTLLIITKANCYKTEIMKYLFILRQELIQDQRIYFSSIFKQTINNSIIFQENKKYKKPKDKKDCQKVITVLKQLEMLIQFFLQSDPTKYSLEIAQIREKIFKAKHPNFNNGIASVQKLKLEKNESQIPNSLLSGDWDDVLNLGDESQNMKIQKHQIFNISSQK